MVTGAFGYSGKYIARRLLKEGHIVRTLTNSPNRPSEFQGRIAAFPLCFDRPVELGESLRGVHTLYNTYWVRFDHMSFNHATAVSNTRILFEAAKRAGVQRIVHVSITNPSEDSHLPYFRGKGELERALYESGVSHAILRPTVLFGREDILINNIAWMLRRFPVFGVFGDGAYKLQPIHVDDLAALAVEQGSHSDDIVIDAIGPETFSFRELVAAVGEGIERRRPIVGIPPWLARWVGAGIGWWKQDVTITPEEIDGLMSNLLFVSSPAAGQTRLSDWVRQHADELGTRYASELERRRDRAVAYA
jgi:NADH dehydrogenase